VLRAFQEVEDNLALIRWARASAQSLETAGKAAKKTLELSLALYRDGAVNYLEVVVAQEAELEVERATLAVSTNQYTATVGLILATGGGWDFAKIADAGPLVTPK
jgi:outer membrane protein TolC